MGGGPIYEVFSLLFEEGGGENGEKKESGIVFCFAKKPPRVLGKKLLKKSIIIYNIFSVEN